MAADAVVARPCGAIPAGPQYPVGLFGSTGRATPTSRARGFQFFVHVHHVFPSGLNHEQADVPFDKSAQRSKLSLDRLQRGSLHWGGITMRSMKVALATMITVGAMAAPAHAYYDARY